ncbi:MAG TPA: hypothetical protein DDW67_06245 [Elusimicrobia bacterium]|jgi:drug/metabolite transporter (DMT)-like permease|nr:hypothetical protein [Elusimicrobiota bacterium]
MEKKVKTMRNIMSVLIVLSVMSTFIIKGAYMIAGVVAVAVIAFALAVRKVAHPEPDEREVHLSLLACYGAFGITVCFTAVMQALSPEGARFYQNVQSVLVVSLVVFMGLLRGRITVNGK